jgi:hypothetical protein
MLKRKIESKIVDWIRNDKKALLIDGARQVGKTYIIRECLRREQKNFIEFNLIKTPEIIPLLKNFETVNDLITRLSFFSDQKFVKGETFIFFDEIQECKEIVTKIKFLVDDGSFRYVMSGSLLGVKLRNIQSAPVGYLNTLTMYPLDFEEFLQLYNFTDDLRTELYHSFTTYSAVNEVIHKKMMEIFHLYLIVGGMPAAVQKFQETHNLEDVVSEHENIVLQYKRDFTKYESEDKKPYLTRIYDLIPSEIEEKNKRFNFVDLQKGLRYDRSQEDFIWLADAGVALPIYNTTEPRIPLRINQKCSLFKLFLLDVGMLTSAYGRATKLKILNQEKGIDNGAIYENVVAQELIAHGFSAYYYSSKKTGEVDFIVESDESVLPIEVKSGKDYQTHSALSAIMGNQDYQIPKAIVFNNYNISVKGKIVYLPIYMVMFLRKDNCLLPKIDISRLSF